MQYGETPVEIAGVRSCISTFESIRVAANVEMQDLTPTQLDSLRASPAQFSSVSPW